MSRRTPEKGRIRKDSPDSSMSDEAEPRKRVEMTIYSEKNIADISADGVANEFAVSGKLPVPSRNRARRLTENFQKQRR